MMKRIKFNIYSVIGISYIVAMTTWAASSVGRTSTTCGEPYSWGLPFSMFVLVLFPFIIGGMAEQINR